MSLEKEAYEQEAFWNNIMGEHAEFIRGLLDPTEKDLMVKANNLQMNLRGLKRNPNRQWKEQCHLKRLLMKVLSPQHRSVILNQRELREY